TKDEPFRELLGGWIDQLLRGIGSVGGLALALQVDHVLQDGEITGELRFRLLGGLVIRGRLPVVLPRNALGSLGLLCFGLLYLSLFCCRLLCFDLLCFGRRGCLARKSRGTFRLLGWRGLLVRRCERDARRRGESRQHEQTWPWPAHWSTHLAHSVIPP